MAIKKANKKTEEKTPPKKTSGRSARSEEGSMSKADAFNKAKATGSVEAGKYEAVIDEFVLQKADEKGHSARIKFKIASEGDAQGQTTTQWYKLFNADKTPAQGLQFLKKDLAILGFDDVQFDDLEDAFEEITQNHPGVAITVKHNDGFVNTYLQGLCEDSEVIADFLANNPY